MIIRELTEIIQMIADAELQGENVVIHGVTIDSRAIAFGNLFFPIIGKNSNGHDYINGAIQNGAAATLWERNQPNPPKEIPVIFVENTLTALQQLAASYRGQLKQTSFIGVTGSNGKTSTKDILHQVLSTHFKTEKTIGNYNNHIGVPLTLLSLSEDTEMAVIEMGMDHLLEIEFLSNMVRPHFAIITNIGNAHLATMESLENIAKAKLEIVSGLKEDGVLIINGDDDLLIDQAKKEGCKQVTFGEKEKNDLYLTSVCQDETSLQFTVSNSSTIFELPLIGQHQAVNCLAVIQIARFVQLSDDDIQAGFSKVKLTGQRNEIKQIGNVTIINDTYKSNPESVKAALKTLEALPSQKRKIFIMGDMADMGEQDILLHEEVGVLLAESNIDLVLGYGELTSHTISSIKEKETSCQARHFQQESELVAAIIAETIKPCTILLKASRSFQLEKVVEAIEERLVE